MVRGKTRGFVALVIVAMVFAACGGGDSGDDTVNGGDDAPGVTPAVTAPSAEDLAEDPEGAVEDLADDLEETQDAVGGGSATLTVGDQTWTFESVLCAFGEEQIGQEGAEFVLSSIQEGMQFYVSIDSFGHNVSLDDIDDFANPSVSLATFDNTEFINLDGKNSSGTAGFVDQTTDDFGETEGSFEATCP